MRPLLQGKSSERTRGWGLPRRSAARILIVLVALGALTLSLSKYKPGQRAWEEYKAERVAKGELVDWKDSVRFKMPPELENFAATPCSAGWGGEDSTMKISTAG